jgi:chemotaxis protein MotB
MPKKKKHPEHANHERWLVSYADFITLLFAFFVVMFAVSQVDKGKLGRFTESVRAVTLWNGPELAMSGEGKGASDTPVTLIPTNVIVSTTPAGAELGLIRDLLRQRLKAAISGRRISVEQEANRVIVRLQDAGFFDEGSADLRPEGRADLVSVAAAIRDLPYAIRIEGHTDSLPISNSRFRSNWELSAARAAVVLGGLRDRGGIGEARFSIAGYADQHPVASNTTPEGRRKNRRVDIVLTDPTREADTAPPLPNAGARHRGSTPPAGASAPPPADAGVSRAAPAGTPGTTAGGRANP